MRDSISARQRDVLAFIARYISEAGYPPSIREIGEALELRSTNGVTEHLRKLTAKGYIHRDNARSRAYHLTSRAAEELGIDLGQDHRPDPTTTEAALSTVAVPLLGDIAAGLPIEGQARDGEFLHVDAGLLGPTGKGGLVALRVQGESMIGDGIFDGDIVFVREQNEASRGEMVAVLVDGAVTVKRCFRRNGEVVLEPSNPAMEPIVVRPEDAREVQILGKVIGVFRSVH